MKMEKKYQQMDEANMNDLVATFKTRHEDALQKKTKIEIGASLIETCPDFIPQSVSEIVKIHKKFVKSAKSAGLPALGIREYKNALCFCIKNLLNLATPQLVDNNDFNLAPSLTAAEVNNKITKVLLLYKLAEPSIRQHIVYS